MIFYWLQDRTAQGQFQMYWGPGKTNLEYYHIKHHSSAHHRQIRPIYLDTEQAANYLVACLLQGWNKPRYLAIT